MITILPWKPSDIDQKQERERHAIIGIMKNNFLILFGGKKKKKKNEALTEWQIWKMAN